MRRFLTLLVTLVVFGVGSALGQTKQITGKVISSDDQKPIPGVSVYVKEVPNLGTSTDIEGNYTLKNVPAKAKTIIFRFVGFQTLEVPISGTVINAKLNSEAQKLEEVMVVAYGTAKKESFTGSAEVVSSKKLEKRTVSNVTKAIEGLATGVLTTSGGGQPGSIADVIIRGFGSINASQKPLYVVDGIPFDGVLNSLNPSDIESMSILKDASAGSLFGSRGANGVVMITTKKGNKAGEKSKINFKASWGMSQRAIPAYELMNEKEWLEYQFLAYKNNEIYKNGVDPSVAGIAAIKAMTNGSDKILGGPNEPYNPYNFKMLELIDTKTGKIRSDAKLRYHDNWMDEALAENPIRQEYITTLTGGNEKTQYMSSIGYLKEEGLLKTTSFNRFSGRANIESSPSEWLKYGFNVNLSQTESSYLDAEGTASSNVWYSAMLMAPIYPTYERDEQGAIILDELGNKKFDYGSNRGAGAQQGYNCIATLYNDKFNSTTDNASARTFVNFLDLKDGFLKGLKLATNFGVDYISKNTHTYENPFFGNAAGSKGRAFRYNERVLSYTFNQIISYNRSIAEKHQIDLTLGHEYYSYKYNQMNAGKTGFPFGGIYELDAAATVKSAGSSIDEYNLESYFSRLNYSFDDRYYLSVSYRTDGSSRFHKDGRWGNFWSVGGNWRISKESFLQNARWIDNLSLRASYGSQGNDKVGSYYAWQALYDLGYPNAGRSGGLANSLENAKLKWETIKSTNIGIDGRFFNRISLTAEWYKRKTSDMLLDYPIALSLGYESFSKNVGSMENSGIELSISGDVIKSEDFKWSLTIMGSTVKNKVKSLSDKPEIITGNYITKEGETFRSFYLPESAGIDPATGLQLYWVWDTDANGVRSEKYISTSPTKANTCRLIKGSRMPKLYGSISNDIKFKDFDFSILCGYSIGGKILDGVYNGLTTAFYSGNTLHKHLNRAWKNPGDITDMPRPTLQDNAISTDANLINASYFSIKNVTLGYSLPKKWSKSINVENIRASIVADNVFLFTHLKGMDPQFNFTGGTDYVYTPVRTFSVNLDITF